MKHRLFPTLFTFLLAAFFSVAAAAGDLPRLSGTVSRVIDGDTVDVQLSSGPIRVRLYGVDAPERKQPFGQQAREALARLVEGKVVELAPQSQDRYERMVAVVYLDGVNVNAKMIEEGLAWAYRRYLRKRESRYCALEHAARTDQRGLWSEKAVAPWDWRRKKRSPKDYSAETVKHCLAAVGR